MLKCGPHGTRDPRLHPRVLAAILQAMRDIGSMHAAIEERGRRTWGLLCQVLDLPEGATIEQAEAAADRLLEQRNR
jgi:hypothetical protein